MKKEIEITGKIENKKQNIIGIQLCIKNKPVSYFSINIERKKILSEMNNATKILLNIEDTFEDYIRLIKDLGLKLPVHLGYKEHWKPTPKESTVYYYWVNSTGLVQRNRFTNDTFDSGLVAIFNAFPTMELAEKVVNLSKLDRLILLWQYANDCLFEPDWGDDSQVKYKVVFDSYTNTPDIDLSFYVKENRIYFKTRKQAKAFVEMYKKEIKDTMEI